MATDEAVNPSPSFAAGPSEEFGRFRPGAGSPPLMGMVEVTGRCNMACPLCFADSGPEGADVPLAEVGRRLQAMLDVAGGPIPIQISGGEPTLRDDLPEVIALARRLGYRHIDLVTNGIEIARQPEMLPVLAGAGLTGVYLQFDGLQAGTHRRIRGRDSTAVRAGAVRACRTARLCCTLAVALARGVNDGEVGDVVRFAIDNVDTITAVNFQSATRFDGRSELERERPGYSLREILALIEEQAGLPADTFVSGCIGHPDCNAASLVFDVNGRLEPLFKYVTRQDLVGLLGADPRRTILDLFRGKREFFRRHLANPRAWRLLAKAAPIFGKNPLNVLKSKHVLIFAKSFMEQCALDPERVAQCVYAIADGTGVYCFCAYNSLHRFRQRAARVRAAPVEATA